MSFNINNIGVNEINFNGNEVNSLYVNNTLVWEKYAWASWQKAKWGDIYDLCLAVRNTGMKWPSDIQLGASKTVTFTESILGSSYVTAYLVGIETEGPGTLTFQTSPLNNTITYGESGETGYWGYGLSNLKGVMNSLDGKTSVDNYVIPQDKVYTRAYKHWAYMGGVETDWNSYTIKDQKYWVPSMTELGFSRGDTSNYFNPEFTVGIETPYSLKPSISAVYPYWTRTPHLTSGNIQLKGMGVWIMENQYPGAASPDANNYVSFCFTIGYFE